MCTLYESITALCRERGIKGGKMCTDLGLSKSLLTDLKSGRKKGIKADTAAKIAAYFGVSVDRVLGNETADQSEKEKPIPTGDRLSELERDLIEGFRQLNQQGKEYVMQSLYVARQAYSQGDNGISKVENAG